MPSHQVAPDVDSEAATVSQEKGRDKDRDRDRDRKKKDYHHRSHSSSETKKKDRKDYRRSDSRKHEGKDEKHHHHHHRHHRKDGEHEREKSRERSSERDKDESKSKSREKDRKRDREKGALKSGIDEDMVIEDFDGPVEVRRSNRSYNRSKSRNQSSPTNEKHELSIDVIPRPTEIEKEDNAVDDERKHVDFGDKVDKLIKSTSTPRQSPRGNVTDRGRGPVYLEEEATPNLNMFFKETSGFDKLQDYVPRLDDPLLESMTEIFFKEYSWPLKLFAGLIWISQFLTLIFLFYSLLPCPDTKPSWLVFIGVPLSCAYAGIESIHHMLRYIHLGKGYRILVFLMNLNCLMQLLCIGVVMGKSEDLLDLISNFVGVAIVLQIDEFLAGYIRIKDIDPTLLGKKSWRTRMMLKSKLWLIGLAAFIVYAVTLTIWRVDSLYCASYNLEDDVNKGVSSTASNSNPT